MNGPQRRRPTGKVIRPLSSRWEDRVNQGMQATNPSKEVALTSTGQPITRKDLGTLVPLQAGGGSAPWLNDVIINAYLEMVVAYGLEHSRAPPSQSVVGHGTSTVATGHNLRDRSGAVAQYHAFNSYFYPKLRDQGPAAVDRWVTKSGLDPKRVLEMSRIFIPVNQSSHWTLLVVSPRSRTIEYFDSLNGDKTAFIQVTKNWLRHILGDQVWRESDWSVPASVSPVQGNSYDCGVFTVTSAKMIMLGIDPRAVGQEDIPLQRRRMAAELLNRGFAGELAPTLGD